MAQQEPLPGLPVEAQTVIDQQHTEARRLFESTLEQHNIPWRDEYAYLIEAGWSWRKAAIIIWHTLPKSERVPAKKGALADQLGISHATLLKHYRAPGVSETIFALSQASLLAHRANVDAALVDSASDSNYKNNQDRKTYYQLIGALTEKHQVNVGDTSEEAMKQMPLEELRRLAGFVDEGDEA